MVPKASVTRSTTHTRRFDRSPQNSVVRLIDTRISAPPMVGVPALVRCERGPSSRTAWPILYAVSLRITYGPRISDTASAVRQASTARSVM